MSNELIPLFPTPLYATEIDYEIDEDYLKSLEYERYPDDTGNVSVNKNILSEEKFSDLKDYIDKHMHKFYFEYLDLVKAILYVQDHGSMSINLMTHHQNMFTVTHALVVYFI